MLRRSHALALSLALGTGSALGLHAAVRGQTRPPTPVPVVAVTRAVSATQTLGAADLRVVDLAPRAVPAGAIRVLSQAEGRTTAVALVPGQYLLQADLAASPLRDGLREGQVAYTLPLTTPVVGVGIPLAGRVAVIAVLTDSAGTATVQPDAIPVLEARVLAVEGAQGVSAQTPPSGGLQLTAGNAGPQALQLALTPKQAETLAWYQQHATLTVVDDPWGVAP